MAVHSDALYRMLLSFRKEEGEDVRRYVREMLWRDDAGLDPVKPQVYFNAPAAWTPPKQTTEVYEGLRDNAPPGATQDGRPVPLGNPEEEVSPDGRVE